MKLTAIDIVSIVQSGEGYNAEFKVRVPNKLRELTEEICAFANAAGGVLLIGVDDRNHIVGVTIDNTKRSAIQASLNEINPHLHFPFYKVDVDGKEVWVIEVSSGPQKPYTLSGAIYVRQGPNCQKITSVEQMRDFFQQSDRIYFDEAPCTGFSEKDIDPDYFDEFKILAGLSSAVNQEQIIKNLKLILPSGSFKNGGVLFFGSAPEQFIEKAVIRCVAFEGITKTQIIDDKIFGGPLMHQYKEAMQWLKGKLNIRYKIEGSGPREEIWDIPETAFKETIINALSHRDYYDKGARIVIELFSNRVEISNPGGLVSAIIPEEFGSKSHSRNPLVFGLFERVSMVEQIGSGIGRIKESIKNAGLPEPVFKTDGMFSVVFKRENLSGKSSGKGSVKSSVKGSVKSSVKSFEELEILLKEAWTEFLGESEKVILRQIFLTPSITIIELSRKLDLTSRGVEKIIKKLKTKNLLIREGGRKIGHWVIIRDPEIKNGQN